MAKTPEFLLFSLEEITLRKIVVNFWNETDVLDFFRKIPLKNYKGSFKELCQKTVEKKVEDKISYLDIPKALKKRMSLIVKPIGLQMLEWMNFIETILCQAEENLTVNLLKHLCWTPAGAIHYERTAEKLARLPTLHILQRFKIASEHCLVDYLPVVWQELPERYKRDFLRQNFKLQMYWANILEGKEQNLLERDARFYLQALDLSAERGNKAAAEYFFKKLSEEDQDSFFTEFLEMFNIFFMDFGMHVFINEMRAETFCYLFSQISPEKQVQTLRNNPGLLFEAFLSWRWHDLFLDKVDLFWNLQPGRETYEYILCHMKMKVQLSECYFPELFQEFIRRSPIEFRIHLVNEECLRSNKVSLFSQLLNKKDKETLKVILRSIDAEDKVRIVSSLAVFQSFHSLLDGTQRHLVEFCVKEACQSKEDRERLKKVYMEFSTMSGKRENEVTKWQRFFESLDDINASMPQKRCTDDETETRVKKPHCNTEEEKKFL